MEKVKLSEKLAGVIGPERETEIKQYYENTQVLHSVLQRQHDGELRVVDDRLLFVRGDSVYPITAGEPCPLCGGVFKDVEDVGLQCGKCTWSPRKPKNKEEPDEHERQADSPPDRQADDQLG